MELRGVYIIWAILPLWYVCLTAWVYLRPLFKVSGREKINRYYPSFFWTGGCLVLAVFLDQFGIVEAVVGTLMDWGVLPADMQINILRFLLYPAVMVGIAQIQSVVTGEDSDRKRNLPKSQWR